MYTNGVRFVPNVDVTHDDDDTNSHMSDPSQLPASVHFSLNNWALATLSPAGGDSVRNVHSLQPIPNQTGLNLWQLHNAQNVPAVLGPQEAAWNGSTCSPPSTRIISCCHSSIWSGCEAKPCHFFGNQQWCTQLQRADSSSATRTRSRRAIVTKTEGICFRDFLRRQIKLLNICEKAWWRNWPHKFGDETSKCTIYVQNSVFKHYIRRYATYMSRIRWTTSALDRIGSWNTAVSRQVRMWSCSLSNRTRNNWSKSFTRSMTAK